MLHFSIPSSIICIDPPFQRFSKTNSVEHHELYPKVEEPLNTVPPHQRENRMVPDRKELGKSADHLKSNFRFFRVQSYEKHHVVYVVYITLESLQMQAL